MVLVIPAVDLMKGRCVRLIQGDPERVKVYFEDPTEPVRMFEEEGAELIHVVDLDAAIGLGENLEAIRRIRETSSVDIEVGGGIRSLQRAEILLNLGINKVIFGTVCVRNPEVVKEAVRKFGSNRVIGAIDAREGKVAIEGWRLLSEMSYLELAHSLEDIGVGALLFTSVSADGTLSGPALERTRKIVQSVKVPVIASGGVSNLKDLRELSEIGVWGAIVGTALYEGRFTLREALGSVRGVS